MGKSSPVRPGQDPASIKAKRLQSTFESHLEIELTLLRALIDRSKFQHRGQPFLQRMREVYRLGQRVRKIQTSEKVDEENLKLLAPKLIHAILKASVSTTQIIELGHFLPTHIPVLAIYGRLFALSAHLTQSLSLDLERILAGQSGVEEVVAVASAPSTLIASTSGSAPESTILPIPDDVVETNFGQAGQAGLDIGQKISRPITSSAPVSTSVSVPDTPVPMSMSMSISPERHSRSPSEQAPPARTPSRSPSVSPRVNQGEDSPDPDFPEINLPEATTPSSPSLKVPRGPKLEKPKVVKKKKRVPIDAGETSKKKKKRNDIDDIFGF